VRNGLDCLTRTGAFHRTKACHRLNALIVYLHGERQNYGDAKTFPYIDDETGGNSKRVKMVLKIRNISVSAWVESFGTICVMCYLLSKSFEDRYPLSKNPESDIPANLALTCFLWGLLIVIGAE
jgi:hypothetical protein